MHRLKKYFSSPSIFLQALAQGTKPIDASYRRRAIQSVLNAVLLVVTLLIGVFFYLVYRTDALSRLSASLAAHGFDLLPTVVLPDLPLVVYHSFPSLIGGSSAVFFVACLRPANRTIRNLALIASITTLLLFEAGFGQFDWLDVMATLGGAAAGLCLASAVRPDWLCHDKTSVMKAGSPYQPGIRGAVFPSTAAVIFSSFLALGSSYDNYFDINECARYDEQGYCEEYKQDARPVYMSYGQLRSSVRVEAARPPDRIGRLYLYRNFVLLNEVNEGIHIIDNTEPTAPVNLAFIRIPGNTEIAVRDNYVYADSYIDLVTLDISDPQNVSIINREEFIFPYDEYQNIPQNISLSDVQIDRDRGVVVSYRLNGS